jgi:hypothetical protein
MATPPPPRLRGREEDLRALGESFDQAASGHLTIVVVDRRPAVVGFILIWGFARFGRQPSWTSQWGSGTTSAR